MYKLAFQRGACSARDVNGGMVHLCDDSLERVECAEREEMWIIIMRGGLIPYASRMYKLLICYLPTYNTSRSFYKSSIESSPLEYAYYTCQLHSIGLGTRSTATNAHIFSSRQLVPQPPSYVRSHV